jgi:mannosyltransferase
MRWNRTIVAAVSAPALLALALRLYDLSGKPLWLDEVITHKRALFPLAQLISDSLVNVHFPTYFVLVRAFDAPLIDEAMLRLPSVLFGSLAVLLTALIAAELRSPRAGLMAGSLMALSPIEVQFSQEARAYTLVSFLVLLALWGLLRIAKTSAAAAPPASGGSRAGWLAYTIGTVAALNVLLVAACWLLASNLAMGFVVLRAGVRRAALLRRWLVAQAIIVLLWLPGLTALAVVNHHDPLRGYNWIPPSTLHHVGRVLSAVYLLRASDITTFELLPTLVPGLGLVVVALALFGAWRLKDEPKLLAVIGLAVITMPAAMLLMSIFHTVWIPRYLLWSTGAYFVLAGIGAAALPRRLFPVAVAALAIAGVVNLAPCYRIETKPRWDLAADYLAAHARPGDSIVVSSYDAKYVLSAYGARAHLMPPIVDGGGNITQTAAQLAPSGAVWLVYGRVGQVVSTSAADYLKKWSLLGTPDAAVRFGRHVVAWRFEREATPPAK